MGVEIIAKQNNFLKGAAILGIAGIIVKILGAVYRIPIVNIIKDEGIGYYQTAYPFYSLLLTIATAGFPVAIAKLASEKRAVGDYKGAYKVFKVALLGLIIGGTLASLFVALGARTIVEKLKNPNAYYSLIALVPALFFVPIMSAFRGFFQGRQNMTPTAISQIAEQLSRVASGLFLTSYLLKYGIPIAAGGASFGGSVGGIVGGITIFIIFMMSRKEIHHEIENSIESKEYKVSNIVKDLLVISIPITLGSSIAPIMDAIDTTFVLNRLQAINYSEELANSLYGQLKGMAQTLINLPQVFSIAISMSLVPAIADAKARKRKTEINSIASSGIRMTLLIGLPCAFGLFVLAKPIIGLLYYKNTLETINSTGEILSYLSFGVITLTLVQCLTAILQGLGRVMVPVISLFIGAVVKVILTYVLTGIPSINIKGAAISTVAAYTIAALLDLMSLVRSSKIKLDFKNIFLKPLISSIVMAIIAKASFILLNNIIGQRLATILAVLIGVVLYFILLIITGSITTEDFKLLPKGDKIEKKLERFKIFK
ncbi:polysaccharide biosynthesis protein [Tissierellaceae bacterium BX21]|jgi:stage V sporulation protein B|uniref:Polysaccharide biosynthesis protein n=1 Tax=Paratissierella segnis TaxID=2763679 RepID=A0A926EWP8_9FIRM|nr:polysaccharide biosynthesis protein [Paratissierella segnis]